MHNTVNLFSFFYKHVNIISLYSVTLKEIYLKLFVDHFASLLL